MERIEFKNSDDVINTYKRLKSDGAFDDIVAKYKDPATKYSFYILEEKVQSGYMIKLDAFRHVQDLRRIELDDEFNYYYDLKEVKSILNFAKLLPNVSTNKKTELMMWQKAILAKMIGWRDENGYKRFSKTIFSVARTNGKSMISSILAMYAFIVESDGAYNADMTYSANTTSQSKKAFSYLKTGFNALAEIPAFKKVFKERQIDVLDDKIIARGSQNKLLRQSQEAGRYDSYHFNFAICDELADDKIIGKIKDNLAQISSGMVSIPGSQLLMISTSYPNSNSIFYSDQRMMQAKMEKDWKRDLENFLCIVYQQDDLSETDKPETWVKSNPILELPSKKETMLKSLIDEKNDKLNQGELSLFQVKNMNMWLQTKQNTFLELQDVEDMIVSAPPINIDGKEVYIGFDRSRSGDISSLVFLFPYIENNKQMWYAYHHAFVPLAQSQNNIIIKSKTDGVNYEKVRDDGFATISENEYGIINEVIIKDYLFDFIEQHNLRVKFFNYDPWNNTVFIEELENNASFDMMAIRQGAKSLDRPTALLKELAMTKSIKILDDELFKYSLKNAVLVYNNGMSKIDKDHYTTKIDPVDALINCLYSAIYYYSDIEVDNKKEEKSPFSGMSSEQINDYFTNDFSF